MHKDDRRRAFNTTHGQTIVYKLQGSLRNLFCDFCHLRIYHKCRRFRRLKRLHLFSFYHDFDYLSKRLEQEFYVFVCLYQALGSNLVCVDYKSD